ncbi:MAG: MATE family efflux transporter [Oscillospiraceae bacterium]|nr:MATE family efflux transporter [Oscillospiraceae bacterium]
MKKKMKTQNEFRSQLLKLVIPISLQQMMMALVSVTDAVMLGFLNQDALSAVSLAGQVQFVFSLFVFAISSGMSILAAQYWGIKDKKSVEKILGIGLRAMVLVSLVFSIAAFACPQLIMKSFASDEILISNGAQYLRAVAVSYFFLALSQSYLCIMKNCSMAAKSSVISSVSVILNIILNALLIFGFAGFPKMGIAGAGVATSVSKAVELIWVAIVMFKKDHIKVRLKYVLHADKLLRKDYWKYAWPVLGNNLVWGIGFTMYSVILGHLGSDATAANSIANIIKNLAICVCQGIATASSVMVGAELGRGALEKAKEYGSRLCRISLIGGFISGGLILCIIPFVPLFGSISETAQSYLKVMLVVSSYYVVGKAMNMTVISGIFPSGGDSKFGLKCDSITMWCVTVPIGLLAAFVFRLSPVIVYVMINIDEIVKLPAVYIHYQKHLWLKNLTNSDVIEKKSAASV